jgi:hypothetical protein
MCITLFADILRSYFEHFDTRIQSYELSLEFRFNRFLLGQILTKCGIVYLFLKKYEHGLYMIALMGALVLVSFDRLNYIYVHRKLKFSLWRSQFQNSVLT